MTIKTSSTKQTAYGIFYDFADFTRLEERKRRPSATFPQIEILKPYPSRLSTDRFLEIRTGSEICQTVPANRLSIASNPAL